MQDPLPPINKVFSLVVQEERQKGLTYFSSGSAVFGMNVGNNAGGSNYSRGRNDKPYCTHCGFLSHTMDKCYKIINCTS